MSTEAKRKLNRLVALAFASVLLVLMYGPLSQWFVAADRVLYDQIAGALPAKTPARTYIVSIDPQNKSPEDVLQEYGDVMAVLRRAKVAQIVFSNPPDIADGSELPDWTDLLASGPRVFVPSHHRLARIAAGSGVVDIEPDNDGVLRRSNLWHLNDDVMSPSLSLAIAFQSTDASTAQTLGVADDAVYLSRYAELPRLTPDVLLGANAPLGQLHSATVFVDADPTLVAAAAVLPSGQFVTQSELTSALLSDLQDGTAITRPSSIDVLEYVIPVLLAILAVLFMPDRNRRDIAILTGLIVCLLLLFELLLLLTLQIRIDLGRPVLLVVGIAILSSWLVVDTQRISGDAFRRGSDFLAAGRLEPAFAEFRRCNPSETVAALMYKLSLAFEQQSKPERAEAVLEWMKRTQGSAAPPKSGASKISGAPRRLGRYVIEKRIGRGAMGAVYLARDPRINRPVALKAIPIAEEFEDEELKEARQRFFREAESAGRLTHPNIITVFDAGEDKGLAYIAMEYVPGISLRSFTDRTKLLAPKRAMELCAATAEGLDYAHNQGIIHRDIKPANLLYNPKDGSIKISDFGVARITDNNATKTGVVLGTPMYMSPEQLGAEQLTGQSDLFSLGVTLYELLIGEVPFKATNIAVLMTKITTEDPAPVAARRAGLAPSIDTVLARAMAKRPQDRFSCGAEMAIALRNSARIT